MYNVRILIPGCTINWDTAPLQWPCHRLASRTVMFHMKENVGPNIVLNLLFSAGHWANQLRNLPVLPQQEFIDGWLVFWFLGTLEPLHYGIIELVVVEYIIDDSPCSTWGQGKMNLVPFISLIAQGQCDSGLTTCLASHIGYSSWLNGLHTWEPCYISMCLSFSSTPLPL